MDAERIAQSLGGRRNGDGWICRCPAHDDRDPSLRLDPSSEGRLLVHCFGGCTQEAVIDALRSRNLWPGAASVTKLRIVATYEYRDAQGTLLYEVVRHEPKGFRQRKPNGSGGWTWNLKGVERVPYRLPDVLSGIADGRVVFIVEGEKDADGLGSLGFVATCNPGGAGKFRSSFAEYFRGANIVVIPDKDAAGRKHSQQVCAYLAPVAKRVRLLELEGNGKDASDWIAGGGTADELKTLVQSAPIWSPAEAPSGPVDAPVTPTTSSLPSVAIPTDFEALAAVMHHPTEHNVARLFEHRYAERLRYCKAWSGWLVWDGACWRTERTDLALDFARDIASVVNQQNKASIARAGFAAGVERFARAARCFATKPEEWDSDEWLLNTPGGIVDLRTGSMRPHRREDFITRVATVTPHTGPTRVFDRFLQDITCNDHELVLYHQRSLGACLSGARSDHFFLFWIGEGRNGKNTLGELVEWVMGDYAKTIPTETLMAARGDRHPTELANLRGVRLAVASEVPEGSHWNESRIKSMTGDCTISARYMRGDLFEFPRTHKHLVYGNHRPLLRVVDAAIRARMHVVPFRATFSDERGNRDPNLAEKLRAEAPAILAWLIEGHRQWLEDGHLRKCAAVERETADYFDAQSTADMWLAERCEVLKPPDDRPTSGLDRASALYQDFAAWKKRRGEEPTGQTRWGEWMARRFERVAVNGTKRYRGVRLKAQPIEAPPWHDDESYAGR